MTTSPRQFAANLSIALTLVIAASALPVLAQSSPAPQSLDQQISDDTHKLDGVESEVTSISDQIVQVEKTLKVADSKKPEVESQLKRLAAESTSLVPELKAKTDEYNRRRTILKDAMQLDYRNERRNPLELVVESGSISETLSKSTYINSMEDKISLLSDSAQSAADTVRDKKAELDGRRSTLEVLNRQLSGLTKSIEYQKAELEELKANRNNEASFLASRIDRAKKQQTAILAAASGAEGSSADLGVFTDGATVRQGDILGFEGSTGFSTGCHTHFSVIADGKWTNPDAYWAILRHPDGAMTQSYGMTAWARTGAYGGGIHNGIDLVQGCGSPVRAAADGVVVRDNRTDGSGFGHYVMLRHAGGLITLYGHLI